MNEIKRSSSVGMLAAIAGLAVVSVTALALLFANADQAARIGNASDALLRTEEVLDASSATRSTIGLALVFAAAEQAGLIPSDETAAAVVDARANLSELTTRVYRMQATLPQGDSAPVAAAEQVISLSNQTLELLEGNQLAPAQELATADLGPAFDLLRDTVGPLRGNLAAELDAERGTAGSLTRAASFGVAFLVPTIGLFVIRSVTRRRRRQAELEASLEREHALSKAKDDMIGSLSHELRTPLTAIYGFALAMEEQGFADHKFIAETTRLIIGEAGRLSRMVEDLLTAGKADSGGLSYQIEDVEVNREIAEALTPFRRGGRSIEIAAEAAVVKADRFRLRHVLTNLVANALEHGGPTVAITGNVSPGWYHIAVVDDGPGVPPDMEQKLFARYIHEGSKPLLSGSVGLGLAVAGTLVAQMEGDIRYERRDGLSVFHFRLPLVRSAVGGSG